MVFLTCDAIYDMDRKTLPMIGLSTVLPLNLSQHAIYCRANPPQPRTKQSTTSRLLSRDSLLTARFVRSGEYASKINEIFSGRYFKICSKIPFRIDFFVKIPGDISGAGGGEVFAVCRLIHVCCVLSEIGL